MDFKIEDKPAFEIFGKGIRVPTKDNQNMTLIPQFWQTSMSDGLFGQLMAGSKQDGVTGGDVLGVCADFAPDMSEFTYLIAIEKGNGPVAGGLSTIAVPALTWAIFPGTGPMPDAIQTVWGFVMGEFFQTSGYTHGPGPDVEVYSDGDPTSPDYKFEVWVPVIKK